jgi:predicted transcriptional regulator of viral defense system
MKNTGLQALLQKPFFTGRDAKEHGIASSRLTYYVNKGVLERVARGVYRNPNAINKAPVEWQDLLEEAQAIPNGTICLISALNYYGMTVEVQRKFWIAIPHAAGALKRPNAKIIRMRNFNLGRVPLRLGPYRTFIFDRERCVIDAFRYLPRESAVRILKEYLKSTQEQKPNLPKLGKYAEALHVKITPYIEALT